MRAVSRFGLAAAVTAVAASALVGLASAGGSSSAQTPAGYCRANGGLVKVRVPTYGTNNDPAQWIQLGGALPFCEWTAKDESRIDVPLNVLYTTKPTLAAIAYLRPPKPKPIKGGVNPASAYCAQLGATDEFGGPSLNGGGWVAGKNPDDVLDACVFPDASVFDAFGIFYRTANIVRGKNLTKILRYHPANPPNVFGS
jgi:hypothetical protein